MLLPREQRQRKEFIHGKSKRPPVSWEVFFDMGFSRAVQISGRVSVLFAVVRICLRVSAGRPGFSLQTGCSGRVFFIVCFFLHGAAARVKEKTVPIRICQTFVYSACCGVITKPNEKTLSSRMRLFSLLFSSAFSLIALKRQSRFTIVLCSF